MKSTIKLLITLSILLLSFVGCANPDVGNNETTSSSETEITEKEVTIKVANWYGEDHPQNIALKKFEELVETKSNGTMMVEIYPNNQLGAEESFIDSVKQGTIQMGVPGMMMSRDVPEIAIAEMPFLFKDWDHARNVLTGEIGSRITEPLIEKAGVRNLAWTVNGFRQISSNKEIAKFEDLKGLRLRVPNVPYYLEMAKGFGANPIAMPFSELFTALEQNVVDGQDNPYPTVRASSLFEVQEYLVETRHMFSPNLWIINEKFFQSLSENQKNIILEASAEAANYNWDLSIQKDEEDKQFLIDSGMKITVPDETFRNKLIESQQQVYSFFYETYPGTEALAKEIIEAGE